MSYTYSSWSYYIIIILDLCLALSLNVSVNLTIAFIISIYLSSTLILYFSLSLSFSLSIFLFSFLFYFSTEKVPKIDRLLGKYKGREEEFLRFVYQKYGNRIIIISLSIFLTARPVANKYHSDVIPNFSPALSWIYYCLPYLYFVLLYPLSYLL